MKCNVLMNKALKNASWSDISLPQDLQELLERGFIKNDGCMFLASVFKNKPDEERLIDKTGVECFINSIHIDDYIYERYLDYACLFCNQLLTTWNNGVWCKNGELNVIISLDEFGAVIKFHLKRKNEYWLNSNLEKYGEAILETTHQL